MNENRFTFLIEEGVFQVEDNHGSELKTKDAYDIGTFHFLKAGWWVWHVVAIAGIFYLGWLFGGTVF